jgi:hypothetical protein
VLAGAGITRTVAVTVYGNVASYPTPVGSVTFTHAFGHTDITATATDGIAKADLLIAYSDLKGRTCDYVMSSIDLGGLTLPPAVYCFASTAALSASALVLDAGGVASAVWIFQVGTSLNFAASTSVTVINGGSNCNVYWQVGSSTTVAANVVIAGTILAAQSITFLAGVTVSGAALATTASITFTGVATIGSAACITDDGSTSTSTSTKAAWTAAPAPKHKHRALRSLAPL